MIAQALTNSSEAELIVGDVRELALNRRFDIITCMGDSFNYLINPAELSRVFRNARGCLAGNGLFIFDMMSFEGLKSHWACTDVIHDPKRTLIMEQTFDPENALGRFLLTGFVQERGLFRRFREEHFERGYRPEEIEGYLAEAGFSFRKYDGHTFGRARKVSDRLLFICCGEKSRP
jgi:SAM-dependent methyltransferase